MRYQELLEDTPNAVQAAQLINAKAYNFLKECKGRVPYAEIRNVTSNTFIGQYNKNTPLDSDIKYQSAVDNFVKGRGAYALRSNSIIVTLSKEIVRELGKPMYIFPLGEYHYHWFMRGKDIGNLKLSKSHVRIEHEAYGLSDITGFPDDIIQEELDNHSLDRAAVEDLLFWELISDDEYYQIIVNENLRELGLEVDKYLNYWINKNDQNGYHELVLNSSDGYLAIDPEYFVEEVLPLVSDGLIDKNNL